MSDESEDERGHPKWWSSKTNRGYKDLWIDALDTYINVYDVDVEELDFDTKFLQKIAKYLSYKDPRFVKFPWDQFNIKEFATHKALYDACEASVTKLKANAIKARKAKEAKDAKAA